MKSLVMNSKLHLVVALLMYIFAPREYSFQFCACLCILFIVIAFKSVIYEFERKIYLSFNLIFMFSLFLCTFIVPIFLSPTDYYLFAGYDKYINVCTSLVVLAVCIYNLGWQYAYNRIIKKLGVELNDGGRMCPFPNSVIKVLNFLSVISIIYYIITFRITMSAEFENSNLGTASFTTILQTILTLTLIINVVSYSPSQRSILYFIKDNAIISMCFVIGITLPIIIGDRTMPIYLLSVFAAVYILLYKRIKLTKIILCASMFAILMYVIGQTRNSDNALRFVGASGAASTISEALSNTENMTETFQDFLPASNCLYLFKNWRETNNGELFYPGKIFILPFSPIPFMPSLLTSLFYGKSSLNEILSSDLSTGWYKQVVANLYGGIGTHVVGDVYVSWGMLGVVVIFFLFGCFIGCGQLYVRNNIYWCIAYITYIGQAMYIARGTLYFCYRHFVLQIILLFIVCSLCGFKIHKKKL